MLSLEVTSRNAASRKQKPHTNNMSFSYAKTLLQPLLLTNPTFNQLTSLNLLKTPGPPVHLQEGSNSSTTCATRRTLKSDDFIGAYLQAKVIGRHFVKLPLEYAYLLPEYAKFFGVPLLLDKGIYGLVYSGKYWNIEFSEWLYSQGFIQSPSEPSYFVRYDKHNQWLRLLFFVYDMLYVGSNDSIEKQFEDSVNNRFDVKFLGPAQWFIQMRIHQHQDSTYTLDQRFYTLCALKSPVCIKATVLVHGAVDFCVQYHGLMHTGDFNAQRRILAGSTPQRFEHPSTLRPKFQIP
jgi:hypothetical protein